MYVEISALPNGNVVFVRALTSLLCFAPSMRPGLAFCFSRSRLHNQIYGRTYFAWLEMALPLEAFLGPWPVRGRRILKSPPQYDEPEPGGISSAPP